MWSKPRLLKTTFDEVNINVVLKCGQSFRWKLIEDRWISSLHGFVFRLHQTDEGISFQTWEPDDGKPGVKSEKAEHIPEQLVESKTQSEVFSTENLTSCKADFSSMEETDHTQILHDYFQLNISLKDLESSWKSDPLFNGPILKGIRTLRQDPFECLLSFVLSSCNNISRISQMVNHLSTFGPHIATINGEPYHDFPSLSCFDGIDDLELKLRNAAFGYRAAYVAKILKILNDKGGVEWLYSLRTEPYTKARDELMKLPGVGRKVADCVCLMSLDKPEAVPVDTHVFQIAKMHMTNLKAEKCSPTVYPSIVEWFQNRFGKWSGWAQGVLFATKVSQSSPETKKPKKEARTVKSEPGSVESELQQTSLEVGKRKNKKTAIKDERSDSPKLEKRTRTLRKR